METTFQLSYPLNSENASPPGTFTVYLSWAAMALPPKALTRTVTIAIVRVPLLLITGSPCVRLWRPGLFSRRMVDHKRNCTLKTTRRQLQARVRPLLEIRLLVETSLEDRRVR